MSGWVRDLTSGGTLGSAHTTTQLTVPAAGVAAGDVILAAIVANTLTTTGWSATDSASNTYAVDKITAGFPDGSSIVCVAIIRGTIATGLSSSNTVTITHPSCTMTQATGAEYSQIQTTPLDQTASGQGSVATPLSAATGTTTQANELLFGAIGGVNPLQSITTETFTAGSGYTARTGRTGPTGTANWFIFPEDQIVSATGTYTSSGTLGHTDAWIALIATYKFIPTTFLPVSASVRGRAIATAASPVLGMLISATTRGKATPVLKTPILAAILRGFTTGRGSGVAKLSGVNWNIHIGGGIRAGSSAGPASSVTAEPRTASTGPGTSRVTGTPQSDTVGPPASKVGG